MDCNYNDITNHEKNKHLTYEERVFIEIRRKDGWSANQIAKALGCAPNTVRNELRRGNSETAEELCYQAKAGQQAYDEHRRMSRNCFQALEKKAFIEYVETHVKEEGWSLDACANRAILDGMFSRKETLCTKTLYNYVDRGFLEIKNIDLPERVSRRPKQHHPRKNKRILGRSIEERDDEIQKRTTFGHWEADLVIGEKSGADKVLLTLLERKTRNFMIIPLSDKTADSVMRAFEKLRSDLGDSFSKIFRTITTDNGAEFSKLSDLEKAADTLVYFAHPYSSYEKGSNERHNRLIRRFIPKGKRIDSYSIDDIFAIEMWCNHLPRKVLGWRTPEEAFEAELDQVYAAEPAA